jgi:hypothetical protein
MDYDKFCGEVLKINPKIRFAGVYNTISGEIYYKMQEGIKKIFTDQQTKDSLIHGYARWKTRLHSSELIGIPIYTMTKYPKINRLTMTCGDKGIIMISTESDLEPSKIIDDVCKLREKYADPEDYETSSRQLNF